MSALSFYLAGYSKTDAPLTPPGTATTIGTEIDDGLLTTRVKAVLADNMEIKSLGIKIETRKGEVMLSGFVNNQGQIDRALEISGGVEGVTKVNNDMSIKK